MRATPLASDTCVKSQRPKTAPKIKRNYILDKPNVLCDNANTQLKGFRMPSKYKPRNTAYLHQPHVGKKAPEPKATSL